MELNYKNRLTFVESIEMINMVYDTVFEVDTDTGIITYMPELYDYIFRLAIAKYYGNYVITMDNNTDYEIAMNISVKELGIDKEQLNGIKKAIDEKIEMRKEEINKSNILVESKFDELIPIVESLIINVSNKINSLDENKINKLLDSFNVKKIVETYVNTDFAKSQRNDLLDSKNKEIRKLKKQLNKLTAKNTVSME